jgi:hypothetical protein
MTAWFETAPEVKPLFRGDMTKQGRKLMATLALVVNGLSFSGAYSNCRPLGI